MNKFGLHSILTACHHLRKPYHLILNEEKREPLSINAMKKPSQMLNAKNRSAPAIMKCVNREVLYRRYRRMVFCAVWCVRRFWGIFVSSLVTCCISSLLCPIFSPSPKDPPVDCPSSKVCRPYFYRRSFTSKTHPQATQNRPPSHPSPSPSPSSDSDLASTFSTYCPCETPDSHFPSAHQSHSEEGY